MSYSHTYFDTLLADILSDDQVCSCENLSFGCVSTLCVKKYKYSMMRKKQKIDVVESDGTLVPFEFSLRLPRILKTDIRRSYANMFVNVMNSGNFHLVFGFFDTFFIPSFTSKISRSFGKGNSIMHSVVTTGLFETVLYWYYNLQSVPDSALSLNESSIMSDRSDYSQVEAHITFTATKIYDIPVETICYPLRDDNTDRNMIDMQYEENRAQLKMNGKRSLVSEDIADRAEWLRLVSTIVNKSFNSFKLLEIPQSIRSTGKFSMYLDGQFRIMRMELETRSDPSKHYNAGSRV